MLVIYSLTILVTLACLLKYFLHKYDQHHYRPSTITTNKAERAPRYPHLDPFFGLDLALRTWRDFQRGELAEGQRRRHAQYGRTFTTTTTSSSSSSLGRGGGAGECIFTIEPANIRAVTTHAFSAFGKASWVAEAAKHVGAGVLLNEGAAWKHSRAMLKPIFMGGGARMDDPALLEPHVRRLVATMRALSSSSSSSSSSSPETDAPGGASLPVQAQAQAQAQGEGEKGKAASFDFHELASMFTLDVVTEFLFGKSTLCLQSPRRQDGRDGVDFLALVREFEGPSGEFIAVGPLAWLGLATSYWRLLRVVDGMKAFFRRQLNDMIEETKTSCGGGGESRSDSSHGRGEEEEEKKKEAPQSHSPSVFRAMKAAGASDEQIQGEVQNIFFASYDTTSAFLANVMHVLVHHPGIQLKLRREIGLLGGRLPTNKDLASFEYLRWFLMEGMFSFFPFFLLVPLEILRLISSCHFSFFLFSTSTSSSGREESGGGGGAISLSFCPRLTISANPLFKLLVKTMWVYGIGPAPVGGEGRESGRGMKTKRKGIYLLTCFSGRCLALAYFSPPLVLSRELPLTNGQSRHGAASWRRRRWPTASPGPGGRDRCLEHVRVEQGPAVVRARLGRFSSRAMGDVWWWWSCWWWWWDGAATGAPTQGYQ